MAELTKQSAKERKHPVGRLHSSDISHDVVPDIVSPVRKKSVDYSKPVAKHRLILNTYQVQRVFEHVYVRTDHSMYMATKVLRTQGRVAEAKKNEGALHALIDSFSKELAEVVHTAQRLIDEHLKQKLEDLISYDFKQESVAPARTGYSMRILNLTQQLDLLVILTEALEIHNVVTPEQSDTTIKSWCQRYRRFTKTINTLCRASHVVKNDLTQHPKTESV